MKKIAFLTVVILLLLAGCLPVATITAPSDGSVYGVGESITFEGEGRALSGTIVSYTWNFGDGETSTGETTTHSYDKEGTYTVSITVTDSDGIHRKLVIAQIDIGEAEDWRWYWTWSREWNCIPPIPDDWPDYILICDPDGWSGNYPIAQWDSRWKDIVIYGENQDSGPFGDYNSIIDEVIKDGFDGIYLDWVDAFENEEVMDKAQRQGKNSAVEMINFIQEMRDYAEQRNSDFIIIQQNAASLIEGHSELSSVIDAIAQEAIWYNGDADVDWDDPRGYDFINDLSLVNYYVDYLDQYLDATVPVFDVEYALNYSDDAYSKSYNNGYIPYCTRSSLSKLTTIPPPEY